MTAHNAVHKTVPSISSYDIFVELWENRIRRWISMWVWSDRGRQKHLLRRIQDGEEKMGIENGGRANICFPTRGTQLLRRRELLNENVDALGKLNEDPRTLFTVLTCEGRFFFAGADVRALELLRFVIDHRKVFVLALNGSAIGAGAVGFTGFADIVLAAEKAYLQVPFSALGLVPENGSAIGFAQSIGVHRANDFLMFGRELTVEELEQWGIVNYIFPAKDFRQSVVSFLEAQLAVNVAVNDGKSMVETKSLRNV
ncbi:ClpP/crotonase [Tothia fuscella]|uniref:ClpP/crotonase n=1 Tax=Tothia fuscella TaxID=1048955 RepID=A0A9P4NMU9_9PEZI|nr:ClpP/crotonase [Tothia fuscella]